MIFYDQPPPHKMMTDRSFLNILKNRGRL